MANKYLIHGATYCGDGTSPDLATADGGVGAWNNLNIFEGTTPPYGTLAAGDTVYIRSQDATGAQITRQLTASMTLGSATATAAAPIKWVVDNAGDVWPGITGIMTYLLGSTTNYYTASLRANNHFIATVADGLVFKTQHPNGTESALLVISGYAKNIYYDLSAQNSMSSNYASPLAVDGIALVENVHILRYIPGSNIAYGYGMIATAESNSGLATLINPQIEILNPAPNREACFKLSSNYTQMNVIGGRVYGGGATSGQSLIIMAGNGAAQRTVFKTVGFEFPKTVSVFASGVEPAGYNMEADLSGIDGGAGSHYETGWGYVTSRTDNNPPTLSATLPDGANTPWAWRIYPRNPTLANPAQHKIALYSQGATAQKTIELEFLVENTFQTPTQANTWMTVTYVDDTGVPRMDSTLDVTSTSPIASSTAPWSSTTWGMSSFNKHKLTKQTTYPVKQGTLVVVTFNFAIKAANAGQVVFLNPEFSLV